MANIKRVRCTWTGAGVTGPGVSTFFFTATASGFPADLQTLFQALKVVIPTTVTISVPNTGDILDETNGTLQGVWTDSGGSTTTGTNSGAFAGGVGMRLRWITGGIHNDRRVIGTTFVSPIAGGSFDTDGTPLTSTVTALQTAASAFVSASTPDFVIWSKPASEAAADGESNAVLAALVPDAASWLRSRRT